MEFKDLKQGMFIRWIAERMVNSWDTFAVVVSVTENEVTIKTLDDFKETTLNKSGEAVKEEITPATESEVLDYIDLRMSKLTSRKTELATEHSIQMRHIDEKVIKLADFSREIRKIN